MIVLLLASARHPPQNKGFHNWVSVATILCLCTFSKKISNFHQGRRRFLQIVQSPFLFDPTTACLPPKPNQAGNTKQLGTATPYIYFGSSWIRVLFFRNEGVAEWGWLHDMAGHPNQIDRIDWQPAENNICCWAKKSVPSHNSSSLPKDICTSPFRLSKQMINKIFVLSTTLFFPLGPPTPYASAVVEMCVEKCNFLSLFRCLNRL